MSFSTKLTFSALEKVYNVARNEQDKKGPIEAIEFRHLIEEECTEVIIWYEHSGEPFSIKQIQEYEL